MILDINNLKMSLGEDNSGFKKSKGDTSREIIICYIKGLLFVIWLTVLVMSG